jgi:hypothetical protein
MQAGHDKQVQTSDDTLSLSEQLEFAIVTGDYVRAECLADTVAADTYTAQAMVADVRGRVDRRGMLL